MKVCSSCSENKALSEFGKNSCKPDGLCAACKICRNARRKAAYHKNPEKSITGVLAWNKANPERIRANRKKAYHKNPEIFRSRVRQRYLENPIKIREAQKKWRKENPIKCRAMKAAKRAKKLKATPVWLSAEQHEKILEFYLIATTLTAHMCEPYHVDHIVPLKGESVCGLHVPWNMQILTAAENSRKKNRMPDELKDWVFHKD